MDRGAWRATVHRVAKRRTWLKCLSMHACTHTRTHTHTCTQASLPSQPSVSSRKLCLCRQLQLTQPGNNQSAAEVSAAGFTSTKFPEKNTQSSINTTEVSLNMWFQDLKISTDQQDICTWNHLHDNVRCYFPFPWQLLHSSPSSTHQRGALVIRKVPLSRNTSEMSTHECSSGPSSV